MPTLKATQPTTKRPTPDFRFVIRREYISGYDRTGIEATVGYEDKKVLQQKWEIITHDGFARHTEWRDVPTENED